MNIENTNKTNSFCSLTFIETTFANKYVVEQHFDNFIIIRDNRHPYIESSVWMYLKINQNFSVSIMKNIPNQIFWCLPCLSHKKIRTLQKKINWTYCESVNCKLIKTCALFWLTVTGKRNSYCPLIYLFFQQKYYRSS